MVHRGQAQAGVCLQKRFERFQTLPLEIDDRGARFGSPEQAGMIFVDGMDVGDPTDVALRDRRMLSKDGIFVVVVTISEQDGTSVADPEIMLRGVPYPDDAAGLLDELRDRVAEDAKSATAQARFTGLLVVAMPTGGAIFAELVQPDFLAKLLASPAAAILLALAAGLQAIGFVAIRRISRVVD